MHYQNQMMNTIEVVLGWDLPDEVLADAVGAQLGLMVGSGAD